MPRIPETWKAYLFNSVGAVGVGYVSSEAAVAVFGDSLLVRGLSAVVGGFVGWLSASHINFSGGGPLEHLG